MTPTPTPTQELEIRQDAAKAWSLTWAKATELTPEQAFTECYLSAVWGGVLACREIQLKANRRIQRLETALLLLNLGMWAAITWMVVR